VAENVSEDIADTDGMVGHDRSGTNCVTPCLVTRLNIKSVAFTCNEQVLDQMSIATQLD